MTHSMTTEPPAGPANRKTYRKPAVRVIRETDLLELLGPAQGYVSGKAMPLDTEWTR